MKKYLLLAALLTGCTTVATPAPQSYRFKGEDNPVNITGHAERKDYVIGYKTDVTISFDGKPQISGPLDYRYTGELTGEPYKGQPTSASCNSKFSRSGHVDIICSVFVGNERTATLTF